ncbi:efflux RND transporter permease subunit [Jannaschia aquimarina]|uniref:AcrF protein n=1 Tax=Jannaschia aquimarina TaxID=935700 RepID=A0A0D1EBZ3_9RHOB|nr:efflux RND transporter permease subunit [Jannaschia aquimarina]KIT14391.1 Multidrug export protein AcrF [Jannaschia aquimarina]SNS77854.1 Multidrug efflux pump subunit AcrB [Jannaschia aquimarina]
MLGYFTRHRTLANLLMVLMVAAGAMALPNMRAQFFPDVVVEDVNVEVRWDNAGAEDVDRGIVQVLEPVLLAVDGVTDAVSTSREGRASIQLEFEPGQDMGEAAADVQAAVDGVTGLPDGIDDPEVRQGRWRDRVTDVVITGPVGVDQLARLTDAFVVRLFAEGVTRTTIRGVAAPEILVEIPSETLLREGVTLREVAGAIEAETSAEPAGDVDAAGARIRTGEARRDGAEIASIVVRREADGTPLTVGDLGRVTTGGTDRERAYFVGDQPAISMRVDRNAEGDAIALQQTVERVAEEMLDGAPEGVEIQLIRTRTEAISGRIAVLIDNAVLGLGLVVALLFLFLNARTAFWVAAGIPVAMMSAIALMWLGGLTINMVSLFALIITLGIVVDDAIVVGEHADFRARTLGEAPAVAAENAARRMFTPVLSATLTTVIAFFGLVAIGGTFGTLIADIPFTVIAVLIASLVECFLILPHHMAGALRHAGRGKWYDWPSRTVNRGFRWVRDTLFRPLIRLAITARYAVAAGAIVLLSTQAAFFITGEVQWRFFNAPERGSITGNFALRDGAGREEALAQMREMQRAVDAVAARYEEEHGANPVTFVLGEIGGNSGRGLASADDKEVDQLGAISIELIDADLRPYSGFEFQAELQDEVRTLPATEELTFRSWRSGPGGDSLSVKFFGADATTLKAAAEDLKAATIRFPEVSDVQDSLPYDKEELVLSLTPQGEALGFDIAALGRELRDRLSGIEAATFPVGPRTGEVRVELPEDEITADFLETVRLPAPAGGEVALADIVTVESQSGFASIRRENGIPVVTVTGELDQDDAARASEVREALRTEILPAIAADRQVDWRLGGLAEQERAFLTDATIGLMACLLGIYLVLSWIFASWTRPAVIMAVIPFGLIGAVWGHWWWDVPLSMFSVVGLIGMTGIIINDSIVLVTTVDEYSKDRALVPAIVDAVADRLRPVLLTTLTTVLGLTPLLYETSSQAQWLRPTVITLAYGLGFGMLLVLLLVPALLVMGHDLGRAATALRRMLRLGGRQRGRAFGAAGFAVIAALVVLAMATLGPAIMGQPTLLPTLGTGMAGAVGTFLAATAALLATVWVVGAVALLRRRA